jgi:predicted dehydrogenase
LKTKGKQKKMKKIGVAVIGTGTRAHYVVKNLLNDSNNNVEIRRVFDPDKKVAKESVEHWGNTAIICDDYQSAINSNDIDWVMVFSPNVYHCENVCYAFDCDKHVFSEKPLATSIKDCQKIYNKQIESGKLFATGFVLRYAPLYAKVKELLDEKYIGDIISIDANENIAPAHGAYIMQNWRRKKELSGPHILEKCAHDLDLLNWFVGSLPSRVASFGGLNFFIPENNHFMDKFKNSDGKTIFGGWKDVHAVSTPFESDKNLMDNQVAIIQYRNNVRVMFQATMSNAIPERRMYFSGTEGTMIAELYSSSLKYKRHGDNEITIHFGGDGHGGGDSFIMKELYKSMSENMEPASSGNEALESSVLAMAIDEAAESNSIVDLEPIWKSMER